MIDSLFADRVHMAFRPTPRGVVGLVDDLLGLCRLYQLRIKFRDGHCAIRRLGANAEESLDIPFPKSVFRAVLARIAAICNEQHPESVTPYRGEGIIAVPPASPSSENVVAPSTCHVAYTNTPSDQHLEMRFSSYSTHDQSRFTVLLRDKRTVTVFGHALKYIENVSNQAQDGSYGIVSCNEGNEVLVALFRVSEVIGVFSGDVSEVSDGGSKRRSDLDDPRQGYGSPASPSHRPKH